MTHQPLTSFATFRRFVAETVAVAPRRVATAVALTLATSATDGVGLLLLVPLLQLVGVDAQQSRLSGIFATFASALHAVGLSPTLGPVLVIYVVIVGLHGLLARQQALLAVELQERTVAALRSRVYRAIAGASWVHFARNRSAHYTQILTDEITRAGSATYYLVDGFVSAVTALVYVAVAFRVSPAVTTFVLFCGALFALAVRGQIDQARAVGEQLSQAWGRLFAALTDHFAGLKIAKSYGVEQRHVEAFTSLTNELSAVNLAGIRGNAHLRQRLAFGSAAMLALIVYVAYRVLAVSTAQLMLLLFLFARLVPRATSMYEKAREFASNLPAFAAVLDVERRSLAAAEKTSAHPRAVHLRDRILLNGVSFDYAAAARALVIDNVTLTIAAGETTAVVGSSGAGKSTLADLVLGLLTPTAGTISVDDQPLDADALASWRRQIGYVAQETFLFHDSVRANLLWARPDAGEADLWLALRLAAADAFVKALPQGLDTIVGDRGVLVSGGERQRLSLARALVRAPALLILDEATSSLDSENELRIQEAIDHLHKQMTIVIITHRLSTIRHADRIHVLDRGRLVESGRWEDLITRPGGRFRELCRAQGFGEGQDIGQEGQVGLNGQAGRVRQVG